MLRRLKTNPEVASDEGRASHPIDVLALLNLTPALERDLEDHITYWGHGAQSLYGFSAEEALGKVCYQLLKTLFPRPLEELRASLLSTGHWKGELNQTRKNGTPITVMSEWSLETGPDGPCAILEVDEDITELRRAREALQRHNQRLRLLNTAAERLLLADDPSHALSSVYEQMSEYFQVDGLIEFQVGQSGDELELVLCRAFVEVQRSKVSSVKIGQGIAGKVALTRQPIVLANVHQSTDPDLQELRNLDIHAYACEPLLVEDRLLGTLSFASRRRDRFDAEDQEFFQTIANYMALAKERLRLMRELQQHANNLEDVVRERAAQLLEANTNLQTFAYTAAHDLRAPLRSIRSFAEIVFHESDRLPATTRMCLKKMIESTDQMSRLLDDLLEYSKLSKADLPQQPLSLDQAVGQALSLL